MPVRRPRATWPVSFFALATGLLSISLPLPDPSQAQSIKLDGSLGSRTTLTGPAYTILHDLGQTRGANLFHSFEQFNVLTGESATFTGPNTISRVISRVTGGVQSFIDGLLGTDFAGAKPEFYLINPSGLLFGPNASLNVSGSAHFSTADYLRFADQTGQVGLFAKLSETTTLSVEPVAAFGFMSNSPAPITVESSALAIPAGETFSLIGGDFTMAGGTLSVPSGLIQMMSVRSPGEVPRHLSSFDVAQAGFLGSMTVSQGAVIDTSGDGGGTVVIRGGKLSLDGAFVFADTLGSKNGALVGVDASLSEQIVLSNGAALTADNVGAGKSGDVLLLASSIELTGSSIVGARPFAAGQGGNVTVMTDHLMMSDAGQIITSSSGNGSAGNIDIRASGEVNIESFAGPFFGFSGLFSQSFGRGNAGSISVASPSVTLTEGKISTEAVSSGRAGDIGLEVGFLSLSSGARILAAPAGSGSTGQGGRISIHATDSLAIQGRDPFFGQVSGIFNDTFGSGHAGPVEISTPVLGMNDGRIQAGTLGRGNGGDIFIVADIVSLTNGALIRTPTLGLGNGGNLTMTVGTLEIAGGASLSSFTDRSGQAGNITVHASESVVLGSPDARGNASGIGNTGSDGSTGHAGNISIDSPVIVLDGGHITTNTSGSGNAGNVTVQAGTLLLDRGGIMTASTDGDGRGGIITISATDSVTMSIGSTIGSNGFGNGDLGQIFITSKAVTVTEGAGISSSSLGTGQPGGITIQADTIHLSEGGLIVASSLGSANGGRISLNAKEEIVLTGVPPDQELITTIATFAGNGSGTAGLLEIVTPRLLVDREAFITAGTAGTGNGGTISIRAGKVEVANDAEVSTNSKFILFDPVTGDPVDTSSSLSGRAGDIKIVADEVLITGGGEIAANTEGSGKGGTIDVHASGSLTVNGVSDGTGIPSLLTSGTFGPGAGGELLIQAGNVSIQGGAQVGTGTFGPGKAGSVRITGTDAVTVIGTSINGNPSILSASNQPPATGSAGDLTVDARSIRVLDGGKILSETFGPGQGGNILLTASDSLEVAGSAPTGSPISLVSTNSAIGTGTAGAITVSARDVALTGGAQITSLTFGPGDAGTVSVSASETITLSGQNGPGTRASGVFAGTERGSSGRGGSAIVKAKQITLGDRSTISSSALGSGSGGNVSAEAEAGIMLMGASAIRSVSEGIGNAGNITLAAGDTIRLVDSTVTSQATVASGGNVKFTAPNLIQIVNGQIVTLVQGGTQTVGGNINIDPQFVVLQNSQILATATQGNGGNITIAGNVILVDPGSIIDASSQLGVSGQVAIQAPVNNIAAALSRLSQSTLNAAELLTARCSARLREGTTSSLTMAGRDGVPAEPGSYRPTAFVATAYRPAGAPTLTTRAGTTIRPPLVLQSPRPEFYALRDASPLPLGCGS